MTISKTDYIGVVPIIEIRNFFKKARNKNEIFAFDEFMTSLNLVNAEAADCISGLIAKGFIEESDERYKLTLKGNALSIARCTHRINKEKADKIFSDLIQRVQEINNDDTYLHKVSKLFLFGSYSDPSKEDFGDIDIAFKLRRKIGNPDEFMEANDKLVKAAQKNGKQFYSNLDKQFYSENLVLLKLKNRNRYISLHPLEDGIFDFVDTLLVYSEE